MSRAHSSRMGPVRPSHQALALASASGLPGLPNFCQRSFLCLRYSRALRACSSEKAGTHNGVRAQKLT